MPAFWTIVCGVWLCQLLHHGLGDGIVEEEDGLARNCCCRHRHLHCNRPVGQLVGMEKEDGRQGKFLYPTPPPLLLGLLNDLLSSSFSSSSFNIEKVWWGGGSKFTNVK